MFDKYPDVLNVALLAEILHISPKAAYKLLAENKISHCKIGRIYRIPKIAVINYLTK